LKFYFTDKSLAKVTEYDICIAATHVLQSMAFEIDFLKTVVTSNITFSNSLNEDLVEVNS
jgi:galactitol-specific phosphotransferase system IIB component